MLPPTLTYQKAKEACGTIRNPDFRAFVEQALHEAFDLRRFGALKHALGLHTFPVDIEEFMFGQRYLARPRDEIFPEVMRELVEINERRGRLLNTLTELVATGGIGSGKTTVALYSTAFQIYLVSCYKNPHVTFGMDSTSEIAFIFQSLSATAAMDVDYRRFRAICEQAPYFNTVFPFDKELKSFLKFPNRVEAKPIGSDAGAIGQNVLGGIIDEVNFMTVIEQSKKVRGGGKYDQAKFIYDGVSRRIKTRFVDNGGMAGILCLVSSRNYPGEFTDVKIAEAESDPSIYVYDKCVWDIKPPGTFSGERFDVFVGDITRKPRILDNVDELAPDDRRLVRAIPIEYKRNFERDITGSIRDLAGVGTIAGHPYIMNYEAVANAFGKVKSLLNRQEHDFDSKAQSLTFDPTKFVLPKAPRWVHIDLAISNDSAGVACGFVPGFEQTSNKVSEERMPIVQFDFILRVLPPKGDEIKFYKIRELLLKLREHGLNIKWASFDGFQSTDSHQLLRQQGFVTGFVSTDMTMVPYEMAKNALYDGRVRAPEHAVCQRELTQLERVPMKNKVDHPPVGSKDCSDAFAAVIYGLTTRKEVWFANNIPIRQIPGTIQVAQETEDGRRRRIGR